MALGIPLGRENMFKAMRVWDWQLCYFDFFVTRHFKDFLCQVTLKLLHQNQKYKKQILLKEVAEEKAEESVVEGICSLVQCIGNILEMAGTIPSE